MNIGKKIYDLRTAKLMTQSELAGDQITRNMLCLIEKGNAKPSLSTILYIAEKLNVSVGYLLADEQEEAIYTKINNINNIKKAYSDLNYEICRDICIDCVSRGADDDEISLILAECDIALSRKSIFEGRLRAAVEYITEALEHAEKTIYYTKHIVGLGTVFSEYVSMIAPSLDMGLELGDALSLEDDFSTYMYMICNGGLKSRAEHTDSFADSCYYKHLFARELIQKNKYDEACNLLLEILNVDVEIPSPFLYTVFADMERCCKEKNDFRGAYEYSTNKIQLFEKMLSDI